MKWVHIGEEIKYNWYELQCQLSQENHLQIFLEGLKNQKLKYCIDFGKILFCRSIDEGVGPEFARRRFTQWTRNSLFIRWDFT